MSVWGVIVIVMGLALVLGAAAAAAWYGWKAYERRVLLRLLARAEAVEAALQALDDAMERLSQADDDELETFAQDPDSVERRALHEVAGRAQLLQDELDTWRLPPAEVPLAEALADAAYLLSREAGCVTDDDIGESALDKLASMELSSVRAYTKQARSKLVVACTAAGLEDTAVYGGGLYL